MQQESSDSMLDCLDLETAGPEWASCMRRKMPLAVWCADERSGNDRHRAGQKPER